LIVSGERSLTRDALQDRIRRAAAGFAGLGIGAGDGVALLLRNDFAFLEASHAASLIGAYAVPINWHWKPEEVAYLLRDCDARAVVVHADLLPLLDEAPEGLPVLVVGAPLRHLHRIGGESQHRRHPGIPRQNHSSRRIRVPIMGCRIGRKPLRRQKPRRVQPRQKPLGPRHIRRPQGHQLHRTPRNP
jgi:acyl-CoA synthetase (AMP-forming)/AMP-acid ligase II